MMTSAAAPALAQIVLPPGQTTYNVPTGNTQDLTQQVTGTGGIDKTGGGTLQFSYTGSPSTNYSGPTNILAGTITANGDNTLSANSAFTVSSGATLNLQGNVTIASLAGAGTVSGPGGALTVGGDNSNTVFSGSINQKANHNTDLLFTKVGTGTLTLSGTNSLDGTTTIAAGTLRAGSTRAFSTSSFNVASGATLDLNGFNNAVAALTGAGTVNLGSATLIVGQNGIPGINGSFTGTITGTGGINVSEHLTLGGTSTYSGTTLLSTTHSSLVAISANAFSPNSALVINTVTNAVSLQGFDQTVASLAGYGGISLGSARLTFGSDNTDTTYSSTISGTGGLTKNGTGTFSLTGNNTYTGNTIVNAGTVAVSETQASTFVLNGGRLVGAATIGGLTVNNATVAPGNSSRVLTVSGNISLGSGSTYQVNADPSGAASKLAATGTASLGGTVQVLGGSGLFAPSTSYTILTAGSVSGTFANVTSDLAFLTPSLGYTSNSVTLTLTRNDTNFSSVASTPDQSSSASAIEGVGFGNPIYNAILGSSSSQAQAAFTAISGQIYAAMLTAEVARGQDLRAGLLDHLARSPDDADGVQLWSDVNAGWLGLDGDAGAAGMNGSAFSLDAGADIGVGGGWRLGVTAGYDISHQDLRDGNGRSRLSGGHGGVYWLGRLDAFALRGGALFQAGTAEINRNIAFLGFSDATRSTQDISTNQVFAEAGYPLVLSDWNVQPFAGLGWIGARAGGSSETGGAAALKIAEGTLDQGYSNLGVMASQTMPLLGFTWMPSLRVAWQHGFTAAAPMRTAQLLSGSDPLTAVGVALAQDQALINADLGIAVYEGARFSLGYQGALASGTQVNGLRADLRVAL